MKKIIFASMLSCLFGVSAFAQNSELPTEAAAVVESYVTNYCGYVADMKLEKSAVSSAKASTVVGYVESVKNVEVSVSLVYGNDDETAELTQTLVLDNMSGKYEIRKATGPCATVIKHN